MVQINKHRSENAARTIAANRYLPFQIEKAMNKKEIIKKVGKRRFFADNFTLAAELRYISGILVFDKYFTEKSTKKKEIIHVTKYPNGLVIKIAKLFSSIEYAVKFSEIKNILVSDKSHGNSLVFELTNGENITFEIKDVSKVRQFLDEIHLPYEFKTKIEKVKKSPYSKTKTVYNKRYRKN